MSITSHILKIMKIAILNVLDIVVLINLILAGDDCNPAGDLDQDGDYIVSLVNLILDN